MKIIAILLTLLIAAPARAGCMPLDAAHRHLAERWQEEPVLTGVGPDGAIMVTRTPDGGTFTVLRVAPGGAACGVAAGEPWQLARPTPDGEEG